MMKYATLVMTAALVALAGCEPLPASAPDAPPADADAPPADAAADASPDATSARCDPTKPFGAPIEVPNVNSTESSEHWPRLSRDELTLYFASNRPGRGGWDVYAASRASVTDAFGEPSLLALSTTDHESSPTPTADGLGLYFARGPSAPGGVGAIHQATRQNLRAEFGSAELVGGVNEGESGDIQLTRDDQVMYFVSSRTATYDIYRVERQPAGGFGNLKNLRELNTDHFEGHPVVSQDDRVILWCSNRTDGGAQGGGDVWQARRSSTDASFGSAGRVDNVNTDLSEQPGWLSSDGCVLYLSRAQGPDKPFDLYVAQRGL